MRFLLDEDVDSEVARRLIALGHEAWTAVQAGLSSAGDDTLTAYAHDRKAVLLTHDREFSARRRRNVIGWHVQLRCVEEEAADLLARRLADVLALVRPGDDVFIALSKGGLEMSKRWE
jgi:predicted nuclease of predicted toxin-antitoxin system